MPTTIRYTVIEGEILSENRNSVKRDYVPDPLGNTLALLDSSQAQTDTFAYYPYGEVASRTGTTATPFQFIGTAGYYQDNSGRTYVRARHLRTAHGRWMTQDPIGFDGGDWNLYRYVENRVVSNVDPAGMRACAEQTPQPTKPPGKSLKDCTKFVKDNCLKLPGLSYYLVPCGDGSYECDCCSVGTTIKTICVGKPNEQKDYKCGAGPATPPPPPAPTWAQCLTTCAPFRNDFTLFFLCMGACLKGSRFASSNLGVFPSRVTVNPPFTENPFLVFGLKFGF